MSSDLSLEDAPIVGRVYDLATAVDLRDQFQTDEEMEEHWPDGLYVSRVNERLTRLVDSFERFWLIERMLKIDNLPILGRDDSFISRAEWLRITIDLQLVRLNSVRDLTLKVVTEVYELTIPPHRVSTRTVSKTTEIQANAALLTA